MSSSEVIALRSSLGNFAGLDRFRRFVRQLNHSDRFLFWHEDLWLKFTSANPEFAALTFPEIKAAFAICEVHGDELQRYSARVFPGDIYYSRAYEEARQSLFPYSKHDYCSFNPNHGDRIEALFCPACCEAQVKWEAATEISNDSIGTQNE